MSGTRHQSAANLHACKFGPAIGWMRVLARVQAGRAPPRRDPDNRQKGRLDRPFAIYRLWKSEVVMDQT